MMDDENVNRLIERMQTVDDIIKLCTPLKLVSGSWPLEPGQGEAGVETVPVATKGLDFPFDLGGVDTAIFTLAPLHHAAGIEVDILSLYLQSGLASESPTVALYELPFKLIDAGKFSSLVYFADVDEWPRILEFMKTSGFQDSKRGMINITGKPLLLEDPRYNTKFWVSVFTPVFYGSHVIEPVVENNVIKLVEIPLAPARSLTGDKDVTEASSSE
jgi:hypothetical protein